MSKIPDVPTAKELGIPVSFSTVRGFAVHADTPPEVAEKIEAAFDQIHEPHGLSGLFDLGWPGQHVRGRV